MFRKQQYHIMSYYYEHEVLVQYPNGEYRFISTRDWESNTSEYRDTFTKKEARWIKKHICFNKTTDYLYPLYGIRNWLYKKRH